MQIRLSSRALNVIGRHRACWLALMLCSMDAQAALSFDEGVARDPDDGRVLYREQHWLRREDGAPLERLVLYRCANGVPFARKRVDYRASPLAPTFALDDARDGYREGLRRPTQPEAFVRGSAGASERSATLSSPPPLVADAGFDEFIHRHWAALIAGKSVPLRFVVPSRLDSYAFNLRRIGSATIDGEAAWIFRLRLGGWLAWLAPHVDVAYGQASRRLLRFEGPSNVRSDSGQAPASVRIDFAQPPQPAPEAAWAAAATQPLSACEIGQ